MTNILTVNDAIRQRISECAESVKLEFCKAVLPIYGIDIRDKFKFVGTCTLIEVEGRKILLTAAHIADDAKEFPLYITGDNQAFVQLETDSNFNCTLAPNGDRKLDLYDFAWQVLSDNFLAKITQAEFLTTDDYFCQYDLNSSGRLYVALGYPRSKNKKTWLPHNPVKPKIFSYSGIDKSTEELSKKVGVNGKDHMIIGYHKYNAKTSSGEITNVYSPKGMSGGVLVDVGRLANPGELNSTKSITAKVVGILIQQEHDHDAILATKFPLILDEIRKKL